MTVTVEKSSGDLDSYKRNILKDLWDAYNIEDSEAALDKLLSTMNIDFLAEKHVKFELYRPRRDWKWEQKTIIDGPDFKKSLRRVGFNAEIPTIILIHGFKGSDEMLKEILDAYISLKEDLNFIYVEWHVASNVNYAMARARILAVGEYVGRLFMALIIYGVPRKKITCIGHSLGAQTWREGRFLRM